MFKSPLHLIFFIVNVIGNKKKPGNCHLISLCDDSVSCSPAIQVCWLPVSRYAPDSHFLIVCLTHTWCLFSRNDAYKAIYGFTAVNDIIARCPPVNVWSERRSAAAAARSHNVHSPQSYTSHDTDKIMRVTGKHQNQLLWCLRAWRKDWILLFMWLILQGMTPQQQQRLTAQFINIIQIWKACIQTMEMKYIDTNTIYSHEKHHVWLTVSLNIVFLIRLLAFS